MGHSSIARITSLAAAGSLFLCSGAGAETTVVPQASIKYEYNSNVFEVPPGDPLLVAQGDLQRADTTEYFIGGVTFVGNYDQQKVTLNLQGREIRYNHYTRLDHSEYLGDARLDWVLNSRIDGDLDYSRDHSMVAFMNRESLQLEVDTSQDASAKVNIKLPSNFKVSGGFENHDVETPLPLFPQAGTIDNTARLGLSYYGQTNLSYGLEFSRIDGKFRNNIEPASYSQSNGDFIFNYGNGTLSKVTGSIGYSSRKDDGIDSTSSGLTGSIAFSRQLTAKTSIKAQLSRGISSYVVGGGAETDTTATLGATWAATYKISVDASISHTHSVFGKQAFGEAIDTGRSDQYSVANLAMTYQFLRWLAVRPYARYEKRQSNTAEFTYDGSLIGIELAGKYGQH